MWRAKDYNQRYKRKPVNLLPYAELWSSIIQGVVSERPKCIVDLACGFGVLTRMLATFCDAQVTGIDYSTVAMRTARRARDEAFKVTQPTGPGVAKFLMGDFMTTELPAADVCVANQVIEHMKDDRGAVKRALQIAPVLWAAVPREGRRSAMHMQSYNADTVLSRFSPLGTVTLMLHSCDQRWLLFTVRRN